MTSSQQSKSGPSTTPSETAGETEIAASSGAEIATTGGGSTTIADTVVEKIAGLAAREIRGVHNLGTGGARAFGAVRERIPGARASVGQGVAVEVGERQAAVDLEVVVEYGAEVGELSKAIRRNVIASIERMTALEVTEVNISINDVFLAGEDTDEPVDPRVQ